MQLKKNKKQISKKELASGVISKKNVKNLKSVIPTGTQRALRH